MKSEFRRLNEGLADKDVRVLGRKARDGRGGGGGGGADRVPDLQVDGVLDGDDLCVDLPRLDDGTIGEDRLGGIGNEEDVRTTVFVATQLHLVPYRPRVCRQEEQKKKKNVITILTLLLLLILTIDDKSVNDSENNYYYYYNTNDNRSYYSLLLPEEMGKSRKKKHKARRSGEIRGRRKSTTRGERTERK